MTTAIEFACKFAEGCHRVAACAPGCGSVTAPLPVNDHGGYCPACGRGDCSPDIPTYTAMAATIARVRAECDRLEAAVKATPQDPDFDGAYLTPIKHIRAAMTGEDPS